ncbi:MAG: hypothetical protein M3O67_01935, partial [Bacteroidota bacterium]|nr:hypothetical protein [Bacteroidota bacterium]
MSYKWADKIFMVTETGFEPLALEIFRYQYLNNEVYKSYVNALHVSAAKINSIDKIPFLPIDFFKSHKVQTTLFTPQIIFESSGTSKTTNSHHLIKDVFIYRQSFIKSFENFYGSLKEWCIIGLLPSYLQRKTCLPAGRYSSLIYMVDEFISLSGHTQSGFYLDEFDKLFELLYALEEKKQKTLLLGVSFALLDFAEKYRLKMKHTVIMETGGMKGRRTEVIRPEVHAILCNAFGLASIHSEYGMTELLSQAYSKGEGVFHSPAWMKIMVRDEDDPLSVQSGVRSSESGVQSQESEVILTTNDSRLTTQTG